MLLTEPTPGLPVYHIPSRRNGRYLTIQEDLSRRNRSPLTDFTSFQTVWIVFAEGQEEVDRAELKPIT